MESFPDKAKLFCVHLVEAGFSISQHVFFFLTIPLKPLTLMDI